MVTLIVADQLSYLTLNQNSQVHTALSRLCETDLTFDIIMSFLYAFEVFTGHCFSLHGGSHGALVAEQQELLHQNCS